MILNTNYRIPKLDKRLGGFYFLFWITSAFCIYERNAGEYDIGYFPCNEFFSIYCRDNKRRFDVSR